MQRVLIALVVTLLINSIYIYSQFRTVKNQYISIEKKINTAQEERQRISEELLLKVEELKNENNELQNKNEELQAINNELIKDNVSLQNSLKLAASVGIKPQNYNSFNILTNRGAINRGNYLGKFLGTAYTPSKEECGNNKGITGSGKPVIPGVTLAVDTKYWPHGTVFYIRGLGYAVAMDTGSAIKGKNRFDFAVFDRSFARKLGSRYWDVYLVKQGTGTVSNISFHE